MPQNTADNPSSGAAKPNAVEESPQAPTQPWLNPIAEATMQRRSCLSGTTASSVHSKDSSFIRISPDRPRARYATFSHNSPAAGPFLKPVPINPPSTQSIDKHVSPDKSLWAIMATSALSILKTHLPHLTHPLAVQHPPKTSDCPTLTTLEASITTTDLSSLRRLYSAPTADLISLKGRIEPG
ncbi:hypothetical protein MRS44_005735 [Fusarium solani]|uniref:uncharacterized protein n=1 Tax=Fusarium solani TaxID=169388 RepID=UPI0032C49E85|nr:hypothetical protein MRS44_005735 [Fusarium solani]